MPLFSSFSAPFNLPMFLASSAVFNDFSFKWFLKEKLWKLGGPQVVHHWGSLGTCPEDNPVWGSFVFFTLLAKGRSGQAQSHQHTLPVVRALICSKLDSPMAGFFLKSLLLAPPCCAHLSLSPSPGRGTIRYLLQASLVWDSILSCGLNITHDS
jgi:hypothetical protein